MADGLSREPSSPSAQLLASVRELLATVLDKAYGIALDKIESLGRSWQDLTSRAGVSLHALLGGAQAKLGGRNPVWGAIRGAVAALSPAAKAVLIIVLVLALVLLPITVVVLLLALLGVAIIAAVRAGSTAQ